MEPISMSTERLRHLLREISERELDYRICTAEDVCRRALATDPADARAPDNLDRALVALGVAAKP